MVEKSSPAEKPRRTVSERVLKPKQWVSEIGSRPPPSGGIGPPPLAISEHVRRLWITKGTIRGT